LDNGGKVATAKHIKTCSKVRAMLQDLFMANTYMLTTTTIPPSEAAENI
jgi:hypothetical protein